jgi:hypothetical protein
LPHHNYYYEAFGKTRTFHFTATPLDKRWTDGWMRGRIILALVHHFSLAYMRQEIHCGIFSIYSSVVKDLDKVKVVKLVKKNERNKRSKKLEPKKWTGASQVGLRIGGHVLLGNTTCFPSFNERILVDKSIDFC